MGLKISDVGFLKNYRLDITLSNGHRIIYNLRPKLATARFGEITSDEIFRSAEIWNGCIIKWNESTELSLDEIMLAANYTTM